MQDDTNPTNQSDDSQPAPIGGLGIPPPMVDDQVVSPTVEDQSTELPEPSTQVTSPDNPDNGLQDIKVKALQQLTPMIGHLNQNAEDRFKTLLMLIQASDNQDLIKDAYAAAEEIADEKAKAQALLDIVNEINYFTQRNEQL